MCIRAQKDLSHFTNCAFILLYMLVHAFDFDVCQRENPTVYPLDRENDPPKTRHTFWYDANVLHYFLAENLGLKTPTIPIKFSTNEKSGLANLMFNWFRMAIVTLFNFMNITVYYLFALYFNVYQPKYSPGRPKTLNFKWKFSTKLQQRCKQPQYYAW